MTRFGQLATTAILAALAIGAGWSGISGTGREADGPEPSDFAIPALATAGWSSRAEGVPDSPHAFAAGWSDVFATSRVSVKANSELELTNLGAPGFVLVESGGLILTDAEGVIEVQRAATSVAMELAPVGIGSKLGRGDRIAFRSAVTIALRNPEPRTTASLLLLTEEPARPREGVWQ